MSFTLTTRTFTMRSIPAPGERSKNLTRKQIASGHSQRYVNHLLLPRSSREVPNVSFALRCCKTIGTVDHDLHHVRRSALNPFFSKRSVSDLAPFIQNIVDALCARFDDAIKTKEPINLRFAYAVLTIDIMGEYCFSRSYNAVQMPDFNQRSSEDLQVFLEMSLLVYSFGRYYF